MKVRNLPEIWREKASEKSTARKYHIRLPLHVAAGIGALAEMYPSRTETQIITDMLLAALDELEESFPYIQGQRIIAEDEFGDPVYEDVGPTHRFEELMRKHTQILEAEAE